MPELCRKTFQFCSLSAVPIEKLPLICAKGVAFCTRNVYNLTYGSAKERGRFLADHPFEREDD